MPSSSIFKILLNATVCLLYLKNKERGKEIERLGFQNKKFDYYMRSRFEFPNMFDSHENLLTFIDHYRRKPTNRIVYMYT